MKNFKIILSAFLIVGFTSCDKDLDVTNPNSQTFDTYWQDSDEALEGLTAAYAGLIVEGTYMRMLPACTDGRGDDFRGNSPWVAYDQFSAFTIPATDPTVEWVWRDHYQCIYRANQVLHYVPDIKFDNQELKDRILGQAYFLRGLMFFNLAINFKNIPLVTEIPNDRSKFYPPTASDEDIWNQIISDFSKAKSMLPASYDDVNGPDQGQLGRATKGAASGMLGKAYLYTKKWQEAYDEFSEIISSGRYGLMADYRDNFKPTNENNKESLFEVQFSWAIGGTIQNWCCEPVNTWMNVTGLGQTYAMAAFGGWGDFLPSQGLYNEFKQEKTVDDHLDPRLLATIASYEPGESTTVYGQTWPQSIPTSNIYPRKYTYNGIPGYASEGGGTNTYSEINYRVLRYSDVLLMAAEALNELGRTAEAAPLIQQVRNRANLPDRTAEFAVMSQQEMRDQLGHERFLELAVEGIRIHDIVRWGWLDDPTKLAMLKTHDPDFNTYSKGNEYLPIPQSELDVNPNLKPNPAN